jgi:hypothetical protein
MHHNPEREVTERFLSTVGGWIAASGEVFVVVRYLMAAGTKDYAFCRSLSEIRGVVDAVANGTDIVVFRERQLPIRGTVTPEFIEQVVATIPDGSEFLVVRTAETVAGDHRRSGEAGDTAVDLRETLRDAIGHDVALGPCPSFWQPDDDGMISASKGGFDGPR